MNTLLSCITKQCGLLVAWKSLRLRMMFGNGNLVSFLLSSTNALFIFMFELILLAIQPKSRSNLNGCLWLFRNS